jgi:hypothetical protein
VIDLLLCAVIDWQRGWCKTVGSNDLGRLSDAQWLLAWVNQGLKEMQETGMPDPHVPLLRLIVCNPHAPSPSSSSMFLSECAMSLSYLDRGSACGLWSEMAR